MPRRDGLLLACFLFLVGYQLSVATTETSHNKPFGDVTAQQKHWRIPSTADISLLRRIFRNAYPVDCEFLKLVNEGSEQDWRSLYDQTFFKQDEENSVDNTENIQAFDQVRQNILRELRSREDCYQDFDTVVESFVQLTPRIPELTLSLTSRLLWNKMSDPQAKPPPGVLSGGFHWTGAFEQCHDTTVTYNTTNSTTRSYKGLYCRLGFARFHNATVPIRIGMCLPDTCTRPDVTAYITDPANRNKLEWFVPLRLNLQLVETYCGQELNYDTDWRAQLALGVIFTVISLVVLATAYDTFIRRRLWVDKMTRDITTERNREKERVLRELNRMNNRPPSYDKLDDGPDNDTANFSSGELPQHWRSSLEDEKPSFLQRLDMLAVGFSVFSNTTRIWSTPPRSGHVTVLDGLRVFSLLWLMYGYTYLIGPIYGDLWNSVNLLPKLFEYSKRWDFQPIINAHLSSDTFFVISGFLATWWWLRSYRRQGNRFTFVMILRFYVYRYWSLFVPLAFFMLFISALARYIGFSPMFPINVRDIENCRDGWWVNFLFLKNFINTNRSCFTWTIYWDIILQLHFVTPVILVPLVKLPWLAYLLIGLSLVANIACNAVLSAKSFDGEGGYILTIFIKPWTRAGPYIIGILTAIILDKIKHKKFKTRWYTMVIVCLGWGVALVCLTAPVFGTISLFQDDTEPWSKATTVAYDSLARLSIGVGVAWIILACSSGYGALHVLRSLSQDCSMGLHRHCHDNIAIYKYRKSSELSQQA